MAVLKLVNNTGLRSERNLCFVNTELQLLYSIPDVKDFFVSKKYRENYAEKLLVCDEVSRIFRTGEHFVTTASELRRLVGFLNNRRDICDGVQQDLAEFHTLLLRCIEVELNSVGGQQAGFVSMFKGKEQNQKRILHTEGGCCPKGHMARTEEEVFQIIKVDVPYTNQALSLNNMVNNHYAESPTTFVMRCSECCVHTTNCPQTGL